MTNSKIKRIAWYWLAVDIALGLLILSAFTSCYSAKKADQQSRKALIKHPEVIAKIARDAFPCEPLLSDSSDYFRAIAEKDSIAKRADSLRHTISNLSKYIQAIRLDSAAAKGCGELLQQVEDYSAAMEKENADLHKQLQNTRPGVIKVPFEDKAKIYLAEEAAAANADTAAKYKALYESEVNRRKEAETELKTEKAKGNGKLTIRIPIWLLILAGVGFGYRFMAKAKKTINPLNWFG